MDLLYPLDFKLWSDSIFQVRSPYLELILHNLKEFTQAHVKKQKSSERDI